MAKKRDNRQSGFCFGDLELFGAEIAGAAPVVEPEKPTTPEVDEDGLPIVKGTCEYCDTETNLRYACETCGRRPQRSGSRARAMEAADRIACQPHSAVWYFDEEHHEYRRQE